MSTDQSDYELFISYARLDNRPIPETYPHGWVTALKDQILADHRHYSTAPLNIFFDIHEIRDMDDWRNRILGALRRSKVLLICLSPNYFNSRPCRWEWDEYQSRRHQKLIGSDSHATVYFVEVPGSSEHDNAKRLDAILGTNFTDLRPWFPVGAAAMREEAVRQRMAVLGQTIWKRLERARRALTVPGNMRGMTPYFVGRNRELGALHRNVGVGKIGLATAVHGLGGQGKTELAVAYARGYADCYPLGIWSLAAEGKTHLLPLLGELALLPEFGYAAGDAERADAERLGRAVLMELQRRAQAVRDTQPSQAPAALVLLDNVSAAELFSAPELSKLPEVDWLRLVATTRLDPKLLDPLGKKVGPIEVDSLDPDNALRLIVDHLPDGHFATPQDEADARQLVKELDGFTLAVEQVAVFLGLSAQTSAPISPGQYLARLRADGLASTDALVDPSVAGQIEHPEKQLGPVLRSMLGQLPEAGRTALRFAARLPPDLVPWPWLRELTAARYPALGAARPGHVDPWVALRRQLEGFRFLTPGDRQQTARMHRLVAAHVRSDGTDDLAEPLRDFCAWRCRAIEQSLGPPAEWELDALLVAVPHLLASCDHPFLAQQATFLIAKVIDYRSLAAAKSLLQITHVVLHRLASADPGNAGWQRDLSVSHNKIGDVLSAQGDLNAALGAYRASLAIAERLASADPGNAGWQRDLSVSQERTGDVLRAQGDLNAALGAYRASLTIRERLASADPGNAGWQRDVWVSCCQMATVAEQQQTGQARHWWQRAYDKLQSMEGAGVFISDQDRQFLARIRVKLNE
jgi:tetratricopeptide (TPR) repeat protein